MSNKILLAILIVSQTCMLLCKCDLLLMYAIRSKISIRQAHSAAVVKEITISATSSPHVAYHYKQDLIFYDDRGKLYRIHLVDDKGDRKISGTGDLFVDKNANHMEVLVRNEDIYYDGLHVDEDNNKLYALTSRKEIIQLDLEGENATAIYKPAFHCLFYFDGMLYFSANTVYRYNIKTGTTEMLVEPQLGRIFDLTVDRRNNKLLFRLGNMIKVISTNSSSSSYPVKNPRVLLSDSQFTGGGGAQALAAENHVTFWMSNIQLYSGSINSAYTFIPKNQISNHGRDGEFFHPQNMRMFYHMSNTTSKPTHNSNKLFRSSPSTIVYSLLVGMIVCFAVNY